MQIVNVSQEAAIIKKILIRSAHLPIPQNSTFIQPHTVPWWNIELSLANSFGQTWSEEAADHNCSVKLELSISWSLSCTQ